MPQVKDNDIVDGWYRNDSTSADGSPRPWAAASVSFKPGQVRYVPASARLESRSVNEAFVNALASGALAGPAKSAEALAGGAKPAPEPKPEPVVETKPEPEPEPEAPPPPVDDFDPFEDDDLTDPGLPEESGEGGEGGKKKKKKRSRSK